MKHVLIIAYTFPPGGGAGVQRTSKFVRYLPEFGWLPTVLTVNSSAYGIVDDTHASEIPDDVEIIRTSHFDPVARFSKSPVINTPINDKSNSISHSLYHSLIFKLLRSLLRTVWIAFEQYILIPDQAITWYPRAVLAGIKAHKHKKFDLIYATGEPYSTYLTAWTLSRLTGVPYVLDMRDPWTLSPYRSERRPDWRKSIERWLEKRTLAKCHACIFANRSSDLYSEIYPQLAGKFHYLPNGYDTSDFDGVESKVFEKFTIVHAGTFLPGYRTADTFLVGLKTLLDKEPALADRMQVMFVGKIGEERHLVADLNLEKIVHQTGYIPHRDSIAYLKGADVLLLVGGHRRWEETGKVYEYMATGKPIIALSNPEGAAAELLRKYSKAILVNRECVEETERALAKLMINGTNTKVNTNDTWVSKYDRKLLTGKLAQVFNECC